MKIKVPNRLVNDAKKDLQKLIRKILETHRRSKKTYLGKHTLTEQSGDLFRKIKPNFKLSGQKIIMEVQMMEYYKYLDEGTEHIEPWFFSEEIMVSDDIIKITEDVVGFTVEQTLFDMVSKFNKK